MIFTKTHFCFEYFIVVVLFCFRLFVSHKEGRKQNSIKDYVFGRVFKKNPSFKIAMSRQVGGRASSQFNLL